MLLVVGIGLLAAAVFGLLWWRERQRADAAEAAHDTAASAFAGSALNLATAAAAATASAAAATALRQTLDALPLPVWRRDPALRVVDCNDAYAAALDQPREAALAQAGELAPEGGSNVPPRRAQKAAAGQAKS